jgi:hypothetical protein
MQSTKPHKSDNNFDRELNGPHAYDKFNKISKLCQNRYLNLIRIQSCILITIALVSSFSLVSIDIEQLARYVIITLSVITLGLLIFQQAKNYMKGWQNARFIAESVLTNGWLFGFKIGIYNTIEKDARNHFIDTIDKIEKEVELKNFLSMYSSSEPSISTWMLKIFNDQSIDSKKQFYIKYRLDDQIEWYTKKAKFNMTKSNTWFILSIGLLLTGIVLTLFITLFEFSVLGLLSTITTAILTWRQTKRFDELKVTYAVAAKELHSLKAKFELEKDETDILKFVEEAEKSISREHKLWFNWTYIS